MRDHISIGDDFVPARAAFVKLEGLGNDFVLLEDDDSFPRLRPLNRARLARRICDRRLGIGADQIILLSSDAKNRANISRTADLAFLNADGSEAEACGNGTRCAVLYLAEKTDIAHFILQAGARRLDARILGHNADYSWGVVEVDMGHADFGAAGLLKEASRDTRRITIALDGQTLTGSACSMGNPHFTIRAHDDKPLKEQALEAGPALERHPIFKDGANISFYRILEDGQIDMEVWERGAGRTLACGTGACAVFANARRNGEIKDECAIRLPGGMLRLATDKNGHIRLIGECRRVFGGEFSPAGILSAARG